MIKGQGAVAISCGIEAATGVGMLLAPQLVVNLALGTGLEGPALVIGNLAGLALLALAIACWPRGGTTGVGPYIALILYNLLAGILLALAGANGLNGPLLWPVVVTHLVLAGTISTAAVRGRASRSSPT